MVPVAAPNGKPFTEETVLQAAETAGVKTLCCHNYRFLPAVRLARELTPDLAIMDLAMPGMNTLRDKIREGQGEVHVVKNTLAALALKEAGLSIPPEKIAGSTLIAFGVSDVVGIAKAIVETYVTPLVARPGG